MNGATNFLIFNHYPIISQGLSSLIRKTIPMAYTSGSSEKDDLLTLIRQEKFDIIIGDYRMYGHEIIDLLEFLKKHQPVARIILLVDPLELVHGNWLFKSGVCGIINTFETGKEITYAIQVCLDGGTYYSDSLKGHIINMDINSEKTAMQRSMAAGYISAN